MKTIKIAFLPAHPAQLWLMKSISDELPDHVQPLWILRDKDQVVPLARRMGLSYSVLSQASTGLWGNAVELLGNIRQCMKLTRTLDIDCWFSKYGSANIAARICGKKSISFNDDDWNIVPFIAFSSYPFANKLLAPSATDMGPFEYKTIHYAGCHELFYLHPARFTPNPDIYSGLGIEREQAYAVIRLSSLQAHHDAGVQGISDDLLDAILDQLSPRMRLFVTSEKPLKAQYEHLRLPVPPDQIHHVLANASLFIGDSQTMTLEAAVLGVPAVRISDFVGRIAILDELEKTGLAYGVRPRDGAQDVIPLLQRILQNKQREGYYSQLREQLLSQWGDPMRPAMDAFLGDWS